MPETPTTSLTGLVTVSSLGVTVSSLGESRSGSMAVTEEAVGVTAGGISSTALVASESLGAAKFE